MEAVRSIQTVTSDSLVIEDVGRYRGQQVEIIILPLEQTQELEKPKSPDIARVRGYFHKYANPSSIEHEKDAWKEAMKEKHAIR